MLHQFGTYVPLTTFIKPKLKEIFRTGCSGQVESGDASRKVTLWLYTMHNWIEAV